MTLNECAFSVKISFHKMILYQNFLKAVHGNRKHGRLKDIKKYGAIFYLQADSIVFHSGKFTTFVFLLVKEIVPQKNTYI